MTRVMTLKYEFPSPYGVVSLNLAEKNFVNVWGLPTVSVPLRGSQSQSSRADVSRYVRFYRVSVPLRGSQSQSRAILTRNAVLPVFPSPYGVVSLNLQEHVVGFIVDLLKVSVPLRGSQSQS